MAECKKRLQVINNHLGHTPKHSWFKPDGWGFIDTRFDLSTKGDLVLNGTRYDYSGKTFPNFAKWIETYGIDFACRVLPQKTMEIDPAIVNSDFSNALGSCTVHYTQEDQERIFHSHGHTLQEMHALKFGKISRCVDIVAYPGSESDVQKIMELAEKFRILLVPFGGGTNVTHSLQIEKDETRMVCSVDMTKMNKVLEVNMRSMTAIVEAGIAGKDLEEALGKFGVCCGHEPDSVEFSTLGGWISTRASGMRKNIYGNIEDIVVTLRIVTPIGIMEKPCVAPRMSIGPDTNHFILGHEGLFGIITQALIKVKFLPECKDYDSILFPNFSIGAEFMYECGVKQIRPASIRLMDNEQFRFGLALKPSEHSAFTAFVDSVKKFYVTKVKGFDPEHMCVCTLVFEGSKEHVFMQKRLVTRIAAKYQGLVAGAENGKRGYFLTYTIAYMRDFGMEFYLYAESFEASVPWDRLQDFLKNVPKAVVQACSEKGVKKRPFVSSRITQIYDTGCCVYVYFGFFAKDMKDPLQVYSEIEELAREEILKAGGSLSHHHGIGKLRKSFMKTAVGEPGLTILRSLQAAIDPNKIMANSNLI